MRMILGLDTPDAGHARIGGQAYRQLRWPLREAGGLLEPRAFHPGRSARDHLAALAASNANAEQRIRRLLALPGRPGLHRAARELGIRHAVLASQIRQLETVTGTTLLRTRPDGTIALTPDGEQFARDVSPVLGALAQSREKNTSHTP